MALFSSIAAQFYTVSSYGQRLIDLSVSKSMAAHCQNWFDGPIRYQKDLLLIIIIISLDTCKTLVSIAYRFSAVMRQTVAK
ncbi:odorant receptor 49a [Drosophila madeirensis]|uniref:Odorant receptor 49a n=1 Tax=Drosophila madeirensis TaxID=30013 RepID=A0AAU9G9B0_DROMD